MSRSVSWSLEDGWILVSLYLVQGQTGAGSLLQEIIAAADATCHAIPTFQEMSGALTRLVQCGLVLIEGDRYVIAPRHLPLVEKVCESGGGLFSLPDKGRRWLQEAGFRLTNEDEPKITRAEMDAAVHRYLQSHGRSDRGKP